MNAAEAATVSAVHDAARPRFLHCHVAIAKKCRLPRFYDSDDHEASALARTLRPAVERSLDAVRVEPGVPELGLEPGGAVRLPDLAPQPNGRIEGGKNHCNECPLHWVSSNFLP